jgi:segregation and condensation protein A
MGEMVQVQVDGFSGPIDLLLDLIDRQKLDITALSLAQVTDQYWREIESAPETDPDTLAEFLNIGSKLIYIKSCALLSAPKPAADDISGRLEQAAEELTQLLEDHKRFRDAVELFRQLEEEGRKAFTRAAPAKRAPLPPGLEGVTLDTLLDAVKEAIARRPAEPEEAVIHIEPVTIAEKVGEVARGLQRNRGRLRFGRLLAACKTRTEIVVLFLAVLEMIKAGRLWAEQDRPFGEITLVETVPEPAS